MRPKFSSKEFRFLKPGTDQQPVRPPDIFFSDLLHNSTVSFDTFAGRLEQADIPESAFVCAVIRVAGDPSGETLEKAGDVFEACFHSVLDNKRGIWEVLDPAAFVLVFWDYDNEKKARQLLDALKQQISKALDTRLIIGVSLFPFREFTRSETLGNALKAIDHAAFFGPGHLQYFDAVSLNISGDRLYQLGKFEEAMAEYEKGLALEPKNINLMNSLGVCHGVTEDLEKAGQAFEQALAISPKEIMIIYNLGLIHQINGDTDKAVLYLRKAHGIDTQIFDVELLLGHLLFKKKKYDQALPHLEAATRANPDAGLPFRIRGEIFLERQDPDKAGTEFNTAVKLMPNDALALSGYALAMARRKRNLKIARTFAQKAASLEPDNALFRERLDEIMDILETESHPPEKKIKSA